MFSAYLHLQHYNILVHISLQHTCTWEAVSPCRPLWLRPVEMYM